MRTNREIYQIYLNPKIKSFVKGKRLEWIGHIWRSNDIIKKYWQSQSMEKDLDDYQERDGPIKLNQKSTNAYWA